MIKVTIKLWHIIKGAMTPTAIDVNKVELKKIVFGS